MFSKCFISLTERIDNEITNTSFFSHVIDKHTGSGTHINARLILVTFFWAYKRIMNLNSNTVQIECLEY